MDYSALTGPSLGAQFYMNAVLGGTVPDVFLNNSGNFGNPGDLPPGIQMGPPGIQMGPTGPSNGTDTSSGFEEMLFNMIREKDSDIVHTRKLLIQLEATGLRISDPRLKPLKDKLEEVFNLSESHECTPLTQKLNKEAFIKVVNGNIKLISKAFRKNFIIPDFNNFTTHIKKIYESCKSNTKGEPAQYIPQLKSVDPKYWGVSVCTIDGQRYSIGDTEHPFTIQSCSKALSYGIALEALKEDTVHKFVSQEPSGRSFNELTLDDQNKPHNPMINSGAMVVASMLTTLVKPEMAISEKFDYVLDYYKRLAGGEYVSFNNAVYMSEKDVAHRNFALAYYMRENNCFPEKANIDKSVEFYFQCCSMDVNCESMSVIAATLANGGICPITDEKVFSADTVKNVMTIMHSCGMYDYSGQFAFKVGVPAKSGVSGVVMIVIPNILGIATWAPPLEKGNSCRGVQFCEELVKLFKFHCYDFLNKCSTKLDPRRQSFTTTVLDIMNLLFSASLGDLAELERLYLNGMMMGAGDFEGNTALHLAAAGGHLDCVIFLIEKCKVPASPKNRSGNTPLEIAEKSGKINTAVYLKQRIKKEQTKDPVEEPKGKPPQDKTKEDVAKEKPQLAVLEKSVENPAQNSQEKPNLVSHEKLILNTQEKTPITQRRFFS